MGSAPNTGRFASFLSRFISHPPAKDNILLQFLSADLSDLMWGLQGHIPEALDRLRARRPELQSYYLDSLQAAEHTFKLAQAARDIALAAAALLEDLELFPLPPDAILLRLVGSVLEVAGRLKEAALGEKEAAQKNLQQAREALTHLDENNQLALRQLAGGSDAIEALKRRETYRHAWRMGEALGRALHTLEGSFHMSADPKSVKV